MNLNPPCVLVDTERWRDAADRAPATRQGSSGDWTAAALRDLIGCKFAHDQLIVVSHRQPFEHQRVDGRVRITRPSSGLVSAVEPVVRACAGTWIAHGSGNADREFVDEADVWRAPSDAGSYRLRRVWLTAAEHAGHTDGFSNSGLWPLCHVVHLRPSFTESDWLHYRAVNQRFADAVLREATRPDPIVMVHDYQLALVPAMLRQRLPRASIVSFWHVPWAHAEQMRVCPWLHEVVDGLLGSDIVGFQTPQHQRNFVESAHRMGRLVDQGDRPAAWHPRHRARARDYPVSIAWPTPAEAGSLPPVHQCKADAAARWRLPAGGKLIVGIDRFDYTKGLIERLRAVEQLLLAQPQWQGRLRFVQVAAPTRTALRDYAGFREQVVDEVMRINALFANKGAGQGAGQGAGDVTGDSAGPIVLLNRHHDRAAVNALYRAADLCLVTSLHDGMNLVCKEFVAARDDEQGVLVLSQFAGAAHELSASLIVNPYHTAEVARAIHQGLSMPAEEQRRRMRLLRATVQTRNVHRWAASMLLDVAALRAATRGEPAGAAVAQRTAARQVIRA